MPILLFFEAVGQDLGSRPGSDGVQSLLESGLLLESAQTAQRTQAPLPEPVSRRLAPHFVGVDQIDVIPRAQVERLNQFGRRRYVPPRVLRPPRAHQHEYAD